MNSFLTTLVGAGVAAGGVALFGTVGAIPGALIAAYGLFSGVANASEGEENEAGASLAQAEAGPRAKAPPPARAGDTGEQKTAGRDLTSDPAVGVWGSQEVAMQSLMMPASNTRQIVGGNWIYIFQNLVGTADPRILAWMQVVGGSTTLRKGSSGPGVVYLQELLLQVGQDTRSVQGTRGLVFDGKFGPAVEAAVRDFQSRSGLSADGVVGKSTAAALSAIVVASRTPRPGGGNR